MRIVRPVIVRSILAFLASLFLLVFTLIVVVHTPPVRRYVLHKASEALRSRGIDFRAATLRYSLFSASATLTGVEIRSAAAPELPPVATIPRVELRARWADLVRGRVVIESARLERPAIRIVRDRQGRDNLPRLTGGGAGGGGAGSFFLKKLVARRGTLRVEDRERDLEMTLPWQAEIDGDRGSGAYVVHFAAENAPPIRWERREIPLDRLRLEAVLRGESLEVRRLELEAAHTTLSVDGTVAPLSDPRMNLAILLRVDAGKWARILGLRQPLRGELSARLKTSGPPAGVRVEGTVNSTRLAYGNVGAIALRARLRLDAGTRRLGVESAQAALLGGTVRGAGEVALAPEAGESGLKLQFEKVDVARLCRALELPVQVASRAEGTTEGRWPGLAFSSGSWSAEVKLAEERQANPGGTLPASGTMTAVSRGGRTSVELRGIEAMSARVAGDVSIGPAEKLQGTVHGDVASMSRLMASLGAYLGKPALLGGERLEGRGSVTARLGGELKAPELRAQISAAELQIGEPARELPPVEGELTLRGSEARLVARAPALGLTAEAHAELRAPYPAEVTAKLTKTEFAALPVALPASLAGEISLALQARGELQNWQRGSAEARVEELRARWREQPIEIREPVEVEYRAGEVGLSGALWVKDSFVELKGALPLRAGTPGEVQVRSRWDLATLLGFLPQEQRARTAGRLEVEGNIRGSVERLEPALNVSVADGRIDDERLRSPVTGLALEARLRGAIVELEKFTAEWAGGTVKGSGRLPLTWLPAKLPAALRGEREPVELALDVDGVKLQSIRGAPEEVQGSVSLQARAEAAEPSLDAVRATVTIPRMELDVAGLSFREPKPGKISLEKGVARIAEFALEGPGTEVRAEGTADLHSRRPLDVQVKVKSNAAVLASFAPAVSADGPVELELSVKGPPANPELAGFFQTENARVALESPPILADELKVRVNFAGSRASIAQFEGSLNGGRMTATGGLRYAEGRLQDLDIHAQANDVFLRYPEGLETLSNAQVKLESSEQALLLGGQVTIVEGSYRKTLSLEQDLLPYALGERGEFTPTEERNALLDRVRFNVRIDTQSPIVVDNNLGAVALAANLRVTGSYYDMGLLGRLTMEEGGQLRLNERTYAIDRGTVTFTSPQTIEASPDIVAKTQASGYDITLQVTKQAGKIRTDLSSQPPLSQPNIIAVLLTGRTLQEARGEVGTIAQQQALSYVAGRLGQTFSSRVQGGLGLTTVRLEPSLISAESSPGARLTLGQDITPRLNLSYSINLADSGDQIWAAQYEMTRRFTTRAVKQSDNSYRFELRQHMTFGSEPRLRRGARAARQAPVVGDVEFSGTPHFAPARLSDRLKVKAGDEYDFFEVQKGVRRLEKLYSREDFLEARVRTSRRFYDSKVDLEFRIQSGPAVDFAFDGWSPPGSTQREVRRAWRNGAFDEQRTANAIAALRGALVREGYLEAAVTPEIAGAPAGEPKQVRFRIERGGRFRDVKVVFSGARRISPGELEELLKREKLETEVYLRPANVAELLTRYYHEHGYLAARVETPRYELDAGSGKGKTVISVSEGRQFRIGKLEFAGNRTFSAAELARLAGLKQEEAYLPKLREDAADRVRAFYLNNGFSDIAVRATTREDAAAGVVNLEFQITENQQRVVKEIRISGTRDTTESLVRKQLELAPGQVLNNDKLGRSLTRLYQTGAYADVDIQPQDLPVTGDLKGNQRPVRLDVKVREVPPWDLSYGAYYDTDRGPGGIVDLANHNMLGGARTIGMRVRYDDLFREGRVYLTQPALHKFFPKAELAGYLSRDERDAFVSKKLGLSFQQEVSLRSSYVLTYGYRVERATTISLDPADTALNTRERIAPLTASLTRETRNDVLDATRGLFLSNSLEVGTKYLGSGVRFVRYVGQYFQYVPLSRPVPAPFSRGVERSRLVWASGLRIGLAGGLGGQELNPSQRFFAGGGTTIRGFGQDEVGPKDSIGQPVGGNAVFLLNQELRFPLFSLFDGAGFVDVGNVYPRIGDFNPFDVRSSAGLGLRVRTPYVVFRVDYGIKLDRKPGESFGQLFISIGQAF
jgi:outer membrane protein assembly complex protein YaeT